jgi:beta-1,4-mannosyltransferase
MLAHVGSLLHAGHAVDLVGTGLSHLPAELREAPGLSLYRLEGGAPGRGSGWRATLAVGLRGARLAWTLTRTLLRVVPSPDLILVQTPPPLPTLPVARLAARLRGARLLVDWHNLGWTILALRFGSRHPLVWATRKVELAFGRGARHHMAVSEVLATQLIGWGLGEVAILNDAPTSLRPFPRARTDLPDDPLVVIAPMGWTRDDDLPLLLTALRSLARQVGHERALCRSLRLLLSGDGGQRAEWGGRLRAQSNDWLEIETPDVPIDDYPQLLGSAHLGLSIHRSSSGMDLPMKIVELQGVGLPVLTLDDGTPLHEIAPQGCGVQLYGDAEELAQTLFSMLTSEGLQTGLLGRLTVDARSRPTNSWDDGWNRVVEPFLPKGSL